MNSGTILIVDDDKGVLKTLKRIMSKEFERVITINDPNRIPGLLSRNDVDVVILDMNFKASVHNGNEGLFWMREISAFDSTVKCGDPDSLRRY
jgi:DNA-binding NtrC family response regulator